MKNLVYILLLSFSFTATLLVPEEYSTIQSAINSSSDGDTILVSAGVYYEKIDLSYKNIIMLGDENNETIIDGYQFSSDNNPVIRFDNLNATSTASSINNFTIRNGERNVGAGIYVYYGTLQIENCIIENNFANNKGGAISIEYGNLTISNSFIKDNTAYGGGGAISIEYGNLTISNSFIKDNTAYDGGGIYSKNSTISINNLEILDNNVSHDGAGIFIENSILDMFGSKIVGNSSYNNGGAMVSANSTFNLDYTLINNNYADGGGAAILYQNTTNNYLINCTIVGNYTSLQKGLFKGEYGGSINIKNNIIWENNDIGTVFEGLYNPDNHVLATVAYSLIDELSQDNINYEYCIETDPQFNDDYTLQSTSPCIDSGDPNSELDPDGTRADMGAYYYHQTGGCTDLMADNYNSEASFDDGSCNGSIVNYEDFTYSGELNGNYYYLSNNLMNWHDAVTISEESNGHLVTITSQEENNFVSAISNYENIYIGLTDQNQEGVWEWITGEPFSFSNWVDGEPNDGNSDSAVEDWVHTNYSGNGDWNDDSGDSDFFAVLEIASGCTDQLACNYQSYANIDDGSCDYSCHDNGDYSLSFDGIDDYVDLGYDYDTHFTEDDSFSYSIWIFSEESNRNQGIIQNYYNNSEENGFVLRKYVDNTLWLHSNGFNAISCETEIELNQWYHVVLLKEGDNIRIYVNGEVDGEDMIEGSNFGLSNQALKLGEGNEDVDSEKFNGKLDNFRIWDTILTDQEIYDIYQNNITNNFFIGDYKFNSGSGDILYDHSGNQNHGTIYGAEWSLYGDMNDDGLLNILDIITVANIAVDIFPYDESADLTGDGQVNILDVIFIVNLVLNS